MEETSTVGLDIAKSVFQVHAISEAGEVAREYGSGKGSHLLMVG